MTLALGLLAAIATAVAAGLDPGPTEMREGLFKMKEHLVGMGNFQRKVARMCHSNHGSVACKQKASEEIFCSMLHKLDAPAFQLYCVSNSTVSSPDVPTQAAKPAASSLGAAPADRSSAVAFGEATEDMVRRKIEKMKDLFKGSKSFERRVARLCQGKKAVEACRSEASQLVFCGIIQKVDKVAFEFYCKVAPGAAHSVEPAAPLRHNSKEHQVHPKPLLRRGSPTQGLEQHLSEELPREEQQERTTLEEAEDKWDEGVVTFASIKADVVGSEDFQREARALSMKLRCRSARNPVSCMAFVNEAVFCLAFADELVQFSELEGAAHERRRCVKVIKRLPAVRRQRKFQVGASS